MNWLDILLLLLVGLGFVKGLFDGVVKQVVSLIAFVAAVLFCAEAAAWLRGYVLALGWFPENGVTVVSYILGFVLILVLLNLAGYLISRLIDTTPLSILNHLGGGLFGFIFIQFDAECAGIHRPWLGGDSEGGQNGIPPLLSHGRSCPNHFPRWLV